MPYEPFLLGVGVVFNLLNFCSKTSRTHEEQQHELLAWLTLPIVAG